MISVIIVASFKWGDYVSPLIGSILNQETDTEIIVVNTSPADCTLRPLYDCKVLRLPETEAGGYLYCKALNMGAAEAQGDWLLFSNDDVLCYGKFRSIIEGLMPFGMYGKTVRHKKPAWGVEVTYLHGWNMIIPVSVYDAIGPFDENFDQAGVDDIEYGWRAERLGFHVLPADVPFLHLADYGDHEKIVHRRETVPGYWNAMKRNKDYFLRKVSDANTPPPG
jgi:GT2 family glycosyltransferase